MITAIVLCIVMITISDNPSDFMREVYTGVFSTALIADCIFEISMMMVLK